MRISIDKGADQVRMLREAYERTVPRYSVRAVNGRDRYVYGRNLGFFEAIDAAYGVAMDPNFRDCQAEIFESVNGATRRIWSSDEKARVFESVGFSEKFWGKDGALANFFGKAKDKAKKALDGIKSGWKKVSDLAQKVGGEALSKWRDAHYVTKDGQLTGLGYKVATGQAKPIVGKDGDLAAKAESLKGLWDAIASQAKQTMDKTGLCEKVDLKNVKAVVKKDGEPVQVSAKAKSKEDGSDMTLLFTQNGDVTLGAGNGAAAAKTASGDGAEGGNPAGGDAKAAGDAKASGDAETGALPPSGDGKAGGGQAAGGEGGAAAGKADPKATAKNLMTRLDAVEKALKDNGLMDESRAQEVARMVREALDSRTVWLPEQSGRKYETYERKAFERNVVGRFFNLLDGGYVLDDKKAPLILEFEYKGEVRRYDPNDRQGQTAYRQFKEDLRAAMDDADGKVATFTVDQTALSTDDVLAGFRFSDFGTDPHDMGWDGMSGLVGYRFKVVTTDFAGNDGPHGQAPAKENPPVAMERGTDVVSESRENWKLVKEGFFLDDPWKANGPDAAQGLMAALGRFASNDASLVKEEGEDDAAPADDAGGGDDPFADAGGDAGGDDPFADAGGDAGGGDDPFADAGGDAGGDTPEMPSPEEAAAAAGEEGGEAAPEAPADGAPAPDSAIDADAQGNQKSQYNINVTKPFNVDDSFKLNEEEQKEFFGKIDQLTKIPDMENYSLYLYQITPENLNLDDVHYITALYDLSVKLGLLEDVYADSTLLDKYAEYKYSVLKDGSQEDSFQVQESMPRAQLDNQAKAKWLKDHPEDRRGPKDTKLNKDRNGVDVPVVVDTTKPGWDKRDVRGIDSTLEGDFHGLGWIATFKAMQFGSPRFASLYIKKEGNRRAEEQCEEYLRKLSYTDIEFVKIEAVDPYDFVARTYAQMRRPEDLQSNRLANARFDESSEGIPTDLRRDVKRVVQRLNREIRETKQFNFLRECGEEKPQIAVEEFIGLYSGAKVDETLSETAYKFVLRKNDSPLSRMFCSNLKEKLCKYMGLFATKFDLAFDLHETPTCFDFTFTRGPDGLPEGVDVLDGLADPRSIG